jgi:hypothetical protein
MRAKEICEKICHKERFCYNCHFVTDKTRICCFECVEIWGEERLPCGYPVKEGIMFKYIILKNKLIREGYLNEQPNNNTIGL